MPTECNAEQFDFGIVEGRDVVAAFDAGLVTSDAGALLLGATDRADRALCKVLSGLAPRRAELCNRRDSNPQVPARAYRSTLGPARRFP
jgi:hypothetical protein